MGGPRIKSRQSKKIAKALSQRLKNGKFSQEDLEKQNKRQRERFKLRKGETTFGDLGPFGGGSYGPQRRRRGIREGAWHK
jgi:hypothetical protein